MTGVTGDPTLPGTDAHLSDLMDQLRPILTDMLAAAVTEASSSIARVTVGIGTCTSVAVANGTVTGPTASIRMDGDGAGNNITAAVVAARPSVADRCVVMFTPPSAAYVLGIVGGTDVPAGVVSSYAGIITSDTILAGATTPPRGHIRGYGQLLVQADYPWLYQAFGTTYNTGGEAVTEFRNIDMRGRIPIGLDNMGGVDAGIISLANTLGTAGGAETHTLAVANLPAHSHAVSITTGGQSATHTHGFTAWLDGATNFATGAGFPADSTASTTGTNSVDHTHLVSGTTGNGSGTATAVNHLPPVRVIHWLVRI